ncbi:hypothetical protein ACFLZ6_00080 [Nanoarchaeota archaeon]
MTATKKHWKLMASLLKEDVPFQQLEIDLIHTLVEYHNEKGATAYKDGWVTARQICKYNVFKSQVTNIPKIIKSLIQKDMAQESWLKEKDKRGRIPKKGIRIYRLIPSVEVYMIVSKLFEALDRKVIKDAYIELLKQEVGMPKLESIARTRAYWELQSLKLQEERIKNNLEYIQDEIKKQKTRWRL